MTPYQYAANNPILFIDVNGDSIWINGGDGNDPYLYINDDQFLEAYGTDVLKNNAFVAKVVGALSSLGNTKIGSIVLTHLTESLNNFTISNKEQPGNSLGNFQAYDGIAAQNGMGSGGEIGIDFNKFKSGGILSTIAHKLGHSFNSDQGVLDRSNWTTALDKMNNPRMKEMDELRVIKNIQNPILKELGMPEKTHYSTIPVYLYQNPGLRVGPYHPLNSWR